MTLPELLAVLAVLLMIAGAMGAVSMSVQQSSEYQYRQGVSLQHGQVTLQRIQRSLNGATTSSRFPGFLVFADSVGGELYPDTLVVWRPISSPADPNGLPLMSELVVYCPNPGTPQELWEITAPLDSRMAPDPSNTTAWRTELTYLKTNASVRRVVLTNLLRTAEATNSSGSSLGRRGVIRFQAQLRPSAAEWAEYVAGTRSWSNLSWVQGIHGSRTGLRQTWCRFEFQLRPAETGDNRRELAIPFFGSGAVMYELQKT